MIIVVGEILIDHFPEYERIGGAPFNFAFHLKHLGWPVRFITRIGDDADGVKIGRMLESNGFDPTDVQIDKSHATGRVEVTLDSDAVPKFDICEDAAYDHIDLTSVRTEDSSAAEMIYFGTLIQRTGYGFDQVQQFLKATADTAMRFCDINFRAPHINIDAIEPTLHQADILKLNDEELVDICTYGKGPQHQADAIEWLMRNYDISTVALTHGAGGSTAFTKSRTIHAPPSQIHNMRDTVGAGDAFASVLAAGTLHRLGLDKTLGLATDFAARVCGLSGAIPTDKAFYVSLKNEFERMSNAQ